VKKRNWVVLLVMLALSLVGLAVIPQTAVAADTTTTIEDSNQGTGVGQLQFSSGWNACSGNCANASDGSFKWTQTTGATVTIKFTGHQIALYGMKETQAYIGTAAIDGGTAVDVDYYAATNSATTVKVYTSPTLTEGTHTLVLTRTDRKNTASTGGNSITFDRAEITSSTTTPTTPVTSSIEDSNQGTGVGQLQFSSGWNACSGNCANASDGSFKWTQTTGATVTIKFTGHQIALYGMKETQAYIGTAAIDGGTAVDVDYYATTNSATTVKVYTSPTLTEGTHTLVLTRTDRKNTASTGGNSITFDRAEITSDAPTSTPAPTQTPTPTPTTTTPVTYSIEDSNQGTAVGQLQFSSGWNACSGNCANASDGSFKWTQTTGATVTIKFTGHQIALYGMKEAQAYIGTAAIDGGTAVDVDYYATTNSATTVKVYTSPTLTEGTHTLVLTRTDRKNTASTGGNSITFDRAEITSDTAPSTTPPTTPPATSTRASRLPWSSGVNPQSQDTERTDQFAAFRGTPVDVVVLHPPRNNWSTLADPQWIADGLPTGFNATRDDLVMTIPLWPSSNSLANTGSQAQWQNLANVIKAADSNAYIRLGWEMNLKDWYFHLDNDRNHQAQWQNSFIQAVQWMKAVAPNLRIVWNPNKGGDQDCDNDCTRKTFQAVKNYVDVYGIDSYDSYPSDKNSVDSATHLNDYLGESLAYAKANFKKFAVPEWGVACNVDGCQWKGNAGGDNPQYIHDYIGFFKANAADLAFEAYFDEPASYIRSALSVSPIGPNAPAAYRADILANVK
jgi:hypothetical protein